MRNSVDFPAPLGPSNAVTPASNVKLTSETATTFPNVLDAQTRQSYELVAEVLEPSDCFPIAVCKSDN